MIRVTVWNEYRHEKIDDRVHNIYPEGIHGAIAGFLGMHEDITVRTATLGGAGEPGCCVGVPKREKAYPQVLM